MTKKQQLLWFIKTMIYLALWVGLFAVIPAYGKLFMIIWFGGLFFQSALDHRGAAHQVYSMSPRMEKIAFIGTYMFQGSSYLSPYTYALLHRLHHAYTDTEKDPHSPLFDESPLQMMRRTARTYHILFLKEEYLGKPVEEKFKKNIPQWHSFDRFAHGWTSRILWVIFYICSYSYLAYYVDNIAPWKWIFVIIAIIASSVMGPLHGLIVNWYGHVWGYRNFETNDVSRNIGMSLLAVIINIFMMGEDKHNNHHDSPSSANFAHKWWEYDVVYTLLLGLNALHLIRFKKSSGFMHGLLLIFSYGKTYGLVFFKMI